MARKPLIRIALVESDPLRVVGFRTLFESVSGFELVPASLSDICGLRSIDLVLLSNCSVQNLVDLMAGLKATSPDLRIIVTGSGDEETILHALVAGAKGYVHEAASAEEFVQAARVVSQGSVWAPRHVFSMFIERVSSAPAGSFPAGRATFTVREKEVLELLVAGRSNKEIGSPLGIGERTVKAHVAKLMRKVGVQNRVALSVHALTHSLLSPDRHSSVAFPEFVLADKTKHYLAKDEVKAVMARRDKIVAQFQKLISEKGEKEVLY